MLERKTESRFPTLVERFVKYAKIHTTSDDASETYPSTERQFDLAKLLVDELKAVGLADAAVDDNCYVTATLPASPGCEKVPAIAFISHMDTYAEVSGDNTLVLLPGASTSSTTLNALTISGGTAQSALGFDTPTVVGVPPPI